MYTALYRKWRPQTFDDVIGQNGITKTLKNEIINNRLSHTYLFIGSRGTGKTTSARIFAKAINCPNAKYGEPCNECEICKGIDDGSLFDVTEIDAASNNGVDNIRDLREEVNYTPAKAKYRVYIIDEVHMLSPSAFNALLKTLEEPPEHVKFILATTEVQKMPATILSRCQRFDFKRIQPEDIAKRLLYIAEKEEVSLTQDSALLIARLADGAMRDALSVMDQCMARSREIDVGVVNEASGLADKGYLVNAAEAICTNDTAKLLEIISDVHQNSCNMERYCEEFIYYFRNIMVAKSVRNPEKIIVGPSDYVSEIQKIANNFTLPSVINAITVLQDTFTQIKSGADSRTAMEMAFIKLSSPEMDKSDDSILKRLAKLERTIENSSSQNTSLPIINEGEKLSKETIEELVGDTEIKPLLQKPVVIAEETKPKKEEAVPKTVPQSEEANGIQPFMDWPDVLQELFKINKGAWIILSDSTAEVAGNVIVVTGSNPALESTLAISENTNDVLSCAKKITGTDFSRVTSDKSGADFIEDIDNGNDPMSDLLNKAIDGGIKINLK